MTFKNYFFVYFIRNNSFINAETFQKASFGAYGQVVLAAAATSAAGQQFASVYATVDSVITYTSAAYNNYGATTLTAIPVPAGSYYVAHMGSLTCVSGNIIANCINEED